ncbi:MAG: hypothetical protein N4P86_00305 [Candidatus Lightella neohaematopini]|nr:hypothetical protein [Candidatus Lightella neohaematopini]
MLLILSISKNSFISNLDIINKSILDTISLTCVIRILLYPHGFI